MAKAGRNGRQDLARARSAGFGRNQQNVLLVMDLEIRGLVADGMKLLFDPYQFRADRMGVARNSKWLAQGARVNSFHYSFGINTSPAMRYTS